MTYVGRPEALIGFAVLHGGVRLGTVDARTGETNEQALYVDRPRSIFGHDLPVLHRTDAVPIDDVIDVDLESETVILDPDVAEPDRTGPRWMGTRGFEVPGDTQTNVPTEGEPKKPLPLDPSRPPGDPQP